MDDGADAATTEATQDAPAEATDSGAIALGDGGTDYFAGMDVPSGDAPADATATEDVSGDAPADGTEEKGGNDEPTFLSVWQEQRRIELQKRRDKEVEEQRELQSQAEADLNEFHADREKKIEAKKKENRDKEDGLREDLNSVFQHGTLWEQVGRLVNLQEVKNSDEESVDRMRNLLIQLKNVKTN